MYGKDERRGKLHGIGAYSGTRTSDSTILSSFTRMPRAPGISYITPLSTLLYLLLLTFLSLSFRFTVYDDTRTCTYRLYRHESPFSRLCSSPPPYCALDVIVLSLWTCCLCSWLILVLYLGYLYVWSFLPVVRLEIDGALSPSPSARFAVWIDFVRSPHRQLRHKAC